MLANSRQHVGKSVLVELRQGTEVNKRLASISIV
jgi:hypothetical protein